MSGTEGNQTKTQYSIPKSDIHQVLSNRRRQNTIQILRDSDNPVAVRDLAERIAIRESGHQPPPDNIQQSVYVSLNQTHLPKLEEIDVVGFDRDERIVWLGNKAQPIISFMEIENRNFSGVPYLLISIVGLFAVGTATIGFSRTDQSVVVVLASGLLMLIFLLSLYQAKRIGWPTLRRVKRALSKS